MNHPKPRVSHFSAYPDRNRPPAASQILGDFAQNSEQLAKARAEVDRLEAEDARLHAQSVAVFRENGNPPEVNVYGQWLVRCQESAGHPSVTAIRIDDVPSSADLKPLAFLPLLLDEEEGEDF